MKQQTNTTENIKEILVVYNMLNKYTVPFKCFLIKTEKWKHGLNGYYEVYNLGVIKGLIKIPLDMVLNHNIDIRDLLLSKIKEDRVLKGFVTRHFNKEMKQNKFN